MSPANLPENATTTARRALAVNALFKGVDSAAIAEMPAPELTEYADGEAIFLEDSSADYLYLIIEGTIEISKVGRAGKQEILAHLYAGEFFGEMGLSTLAGRSANAFARGPVLLGRIDSVGLHQILHLAPLQISDNLIRGLAERLRHTNEHLIREILAAERLSLVGGMAATIVHDLKNPVSTILAAAEFIGAQISEPVPLRMVDIIRRTAHRMIGIVQEILDYSRGASSVKAEFVGVSELMVQLDEIILDRLQAHGIRVEKNVSYNGRIWLDKERFLRALENLIKNAAEAITTSGVISLSVKEELDSITFEVADNGKGIPEAQLPSIFQPFVTHEKVGGTGLGLAMVKMVVEAHAGTIHVSSQVGKGSRFQVTVPMEPSSGRST